MAAFYTIANLRDATPITDPEALHEVLAKMYASYGKEEAKAVPILIKPAPDVRWEFVVEVFNQAARAKFTNIGFAPLGS
jgi:dihydroorotate dehydrogenase